MPPDRKKGGNPGLVPQIDYIRLWNRNDSWAPMLDNTVQKGSQSHFGGSNVNTHLKGRIFSNQGVSYLVLQDDCQSPDLLRVRELNAGKRVQEMRVQDVRRHLPEFKPLASSS